MRAKKVLWGCGVAALAVIAGLWFWIGPLATALWRKGFFSQVSDRTYNATTSMQNLKALYQAMSLYHDSEGQYPVASGWMDAIENRVRVADMGQQETEKKFVRPDLAGKGSGKFGYAMNDECSGKYKGDLKDKGTILLFDSTDTGRNAHGDPAKLRLPHGGGITIEGSAVR